MALGVVQVRLEAPVVALAIAVPQALEHQGKDTLAVQAETVVVVQGQATHIPLVEVVVLEVSVLPGLLPSLVMEEQDKFPASQATVLFTLAVAAQVETTID